ncbi:hypothetical protein StrepF001_13395 [Streptomyces sp. F001]|uniref:aKG-HExxH-type peptide beta-hydroxylase n=1 Tax=Streptomyces sp. F001 TaxID=1510026 RepID=UPI00101E5493|nr:HEXXH motif-containing putative peptide modification protein [Streptomyces sp. F001]RZB18141.1 hypothetical protein StrepF001_13395 [Streptomyces sp. F001]
MRAEPSLPHHRVPPGSLAELTRGEGGPATVDLLAAAERSRRLLLLRMLDDATAWSGVDLLSTAQRRAPAVVDELLMYPQTGMWLATALRRLRASTAEKDEPPLPVVLGHVRALAAAAALRAELDFTVEVPVRHGRVPLPTLAARSCPRPSRGRRPPCGPKPDVPWSRRRGTGRRTAAAGLGGAGVASGAPARGRPARTPLEVALDDLDPYRTYPQPTEPRPLSEEAAAQWRQMLERPGGCCCGTSPRRPPRCGGRVLPESHPARERFRPRSVSSGDAFGGIEASEPDDAVQLAVTLVHEFQHTKLGGLLHLTPLVTRAPTPVRSCGTRPGGTTPAHSKGSFRASTPSWASPVSGVPTAGPPVRGPRRRTSSSRCGEPM